MQSRSIAPKSLKTSKYEGSDREVDGGVRGEGSGEGGERESLRKTCGGFPLSRAKSQKKEMLESSNFLSLSLSFSL